MMGSKEVPISARKALTLSIKFTACSSSALFDTDIMEAVCSSSVDLSAYFAKSLTSYFTTSKGIVIFLTSFLIQVVAHDFFIRHLDDAALTEGVFCDYDFKIILAF